MSIDKILKALERGLGLTEERAVKETHKIANLSIVEVDELNRLDSEKAEIEKAEEGLEIRKRRLKLDRDNFWYTIKNTYPCENKNLRIDEGILFSVVFEDEDEEDDAPVAA